jgi:hypothetical protein
MSADLYRLQIGSRSLTVRVEETPAVINVHITLHGRPFKRKGTKAVEAWLEPIFKRFDSDPRPVFTVNGNTGERSLVFTHGERTFALITP